MRKLVLSALATVAVLIAGAHLGVPAAHAGNVSFGISIGVPFPAPVYVAPAPVYYPPPPVYYAPPAPVYYAPRVVYPAPVFVGGHGHWHGHRHWRGHGHGHGHRGHWR